MCTDRKHVQWKDAGCENDAYDTSAVSEVQTYVTIKEGEDRRAGALALPKSKHNDLRVNLPQERVAT